MKAILQTLIVVAAFFIQTSFVQGQYTYQTAKRYAFSSSSIIMTDSNSVLPPGIQTGCATQTSQPCWFLMGACESETFSLNFGGINFGGGNPSMSIVIYGPFSDTINLGSKLINANIDTCYNASFVFTNSWILNLFNYQRGDMYVLLMMSDLEVWSVDVGVMLGGLNESDTSFCPLCNSQLSELYQSICIVTFDSTSQKNKIIWPKDIFTAAQDYLIFRKNTSGTYDTLGFQSVSQLSEYVDSTSSPLSKLYQYKLGIRDSCGQFMDKVNNLNSAFTTMHLIAYPTGNNSSGLIWNPGSFAGPFLIYRTDPSGITTLIDSIGLVTGTQTYTDINAPAGLCSYQIGVNLNPPCVASLLPSYNIVKSNPGYVTVTGINELTDLGKAISIEPNPFNQYTKIDLHRVSKQNLKVVLRNITGQVLMQYIEVKTDELLLEKNNLSQGIYILEITGNGFYARKKLVVN
ncbi:MAG: T9SS type A sorting domain-containing protein [Bacteroidia bacterium]